VSRALVLGGGGVAGIAWELGVLRGLEEAGVPARDWSLVVGTSAGAIVGARILADPDLERWYAHETRPYAPEDRALVQALGGRVGVAAMAAGRRRRLGWVPSAWLVCRTAEAMVRRAARPPRGATTPATGGKEIAKGDDRLMGLGSIARAARTPPEQSFLDTIRTYIAPAVEWSDRLIVTAVDATDGSTVVIDAGCGAPLDRAVAASAAVPILFPPIRAMGRSWIDGGMSSLVHVDLAADADEILVLAPLDVGVRREVEALQAAGKRVDLVLPEPESASVMGFGTGLLDPARRPAAARAGREDGLRAGRELLAARAAGRTEAPGGSAAPGEERSVA
jgi:NTE family protein